MSLISDALKKTEQLRLEQAGVLAPGIRGPARTRRAVQAGTFGQPSSKLLYCNVALLFVALILMAVVLHRSNGAGSRVEASADSAVATDPAIAAPATTTAVAPREAAGTAAVAPTAESPDATAPGMVEPFYDLTGVTVMGQATLVGLIRRSDGRSFWVNVGETLGGVTVVSYDAAAERATLRVDGRQEIAAMRNASP
ncbi:hypothetical protein K0B96_00265 [Horticoccus luteus]|uniref:Uncharacterized protein n=1 Tax=Horticoccus luteus TaxID=2862869 RepID=A0A8F9TWH4_9BACT|nr:hypothetical protein [Horticoccus luteus]QYM79084.1 hypothetical protein K0B96_00265 [Horticoccus luteus]